MRSARLLLCLVSVLLLISAALAQAPTSPTFSSPLPFSVSVHPNSLAIADFDRDGNLDIALTGCNDSDPTVCYNYNLPFTFDYVYVYLGNGNGDFKFKSSSYVGGPWGLAAADMNRDGKVDLIASRQGPGRSAVLLSNGDGTFQSPIDFVPGYDPSMIQTFSPVVADFNRDGSPDAAFPSGASDTVGVGTGDKTGNLYLGGVFWPGDGPVAAVTADFDQNGTPDLAMAVLNTWEVSVVFGTGYGWFWGPGFFPSGDAWPTTLTSADFNRDGKDDLAVLNFGSLDSPRTGKIAVLLGDGAGNFSETLVTTDVLNTPRMNPSVYGQATIAVGKFNKDAIPDIAVAEQDSNSIAVLVGDGTGNMKLVKRSWIGKQPFALAVGDFNRDGKDDIAVANYGSSTIAILLGGNTQNSQ